ncbi:pectate lyase family protein [Flavobacterium capsici]|uniref:T9SS type A sorting domain-containing protein n=1 Tax=Flavobacterium capsici TaxID=3075618 RepID=A0AA96F5D8_9FLAO|nr:MULTISPECIES: T9SS type A sorting domain-containing protein [unclassified Flavobacterium]WNM17732.1 T9SS type A sorting domain-containing protein [Flavobacterium sp. PMR2A8]WNM21785.1 T9SS type A sorting domain-containing protein [Flavobacterium sp. PMTSA4]
MRKIILGFILLTVTGLTGQNINMSAPEGFGAAATGGGNGTPVTVTTYTAFKNALQSTTAANRVILVSGTIDCIYTSVTLNNKTIIGLPGARLRNTQITVGNSTTSANNSGILNIKPGSNNVIIRNLIFEGPGAYDVDGRDNLTNEGTNIWVDHCEFQDGIDGNFDNKGLGDNVTISWCKFTYLKPAVPGGSGGSNDHRFSNLVGSSSTDAPADGHYSITFQNCYWATGCKERMPRARNAELHILNCYYNVQTTSSRAIGLGGGINNSTCYIQNTHFANVSSVYTSYVSTDGGTVGLSFTGCLGTSLTNVGTTFSPPSYTTSAFPVADVATYVPDPTCGAGATLNVSASGVITANPCANLGMNQEVLDEEIKLYPTLIENVLNIQFPSSINGKVDIGVYDMFGKQVYASSKNIEANENLELNLFGLAKGVYVCKIQINGKSKNLKFIKK